MLWEKTQIEDGTKKPPQGLPSAVFHLLHCARLLCFTSYNKFFSLEMTMDIQKTLTLMPTANVDAEDLETALRDLRGRLRDAGFDVEQLTEAPAEDELGGKETAVLLIMCLAMEATSLEIVIEAFLHDYPHISIPEHTPHIEPEEKKKDKKTPNFAHHGKK